MVKTASIVAGGVIVAALILTYFSPYQTCVRTWQGDLAEQRCAQWVSGR